jgi:hypothetical protein
MGQSYSVSWHSHREHCHRARHSTRNDKNHSNCKYCRKEITLSESGDQVSAKQPKSEKVIAKKTIGEKVTYDTPFLPCTRCGDERSLIESQFPNEHGYVGQVGTIGDDVPFAFSEGSYIFTEKIKILPFTLGYPSDWSFESMEIVLQPQSGQPVLDLSLVIFPQTTKGKITGSLTYSPISSKSKLERLDVITASHQESDDRYTYANALIGYNPV